MDHRMPLRPPIFRGYPPVTRPFVPLGLETLYAICRQLYPDQPNPLQVAALVKFWLGGPDPLDYISMYSNPGNPSADIPPHWHYISFGLSDLHGDGRVHDITGIGAPSGFGFELTFRLKREPHERAPPTWPAAIMQALAKYVFQSENTLVAGDHVSWHCPLDNSDSRIQHMLMCEDPQLGTVQTPFGSVSFLQIVGVCSEELQAAQNWNGPGIIDLMKSVKGVGGSWLVTDMRRSETIFELDPSVQNAVDDGIESEGSNLSGVSARCTWQERKLSHPVEDSEEAELERGFAQISVQESEQIKATLKKGLLGAKSVLPPIRSSSSNSNSRYHNISSGVDQNEDTTSRKASYDSNINGEMPTLEAPELLQTKFLESVHLQFNLEAGTILPLALRGRLKHGRHFTFKSVIGDVAITLVPVSVSGAFVDAEHPFAAHGPWLQLLLTDNDIDHMLDDLLAMTMAEGLAFPKTFECHGTRCAGEVAAKRDNDVCGVGVAYESKVAGIRMLDQPYMTDLIEANSMGHEPNLIDIYSASWGPTDDGKTVDGPRNATMRAIVQGVNEGRRGLGNIYVWASGDGGADDDCNCDGYAASMWTISINSAINNGENAHYDESCSSTLASTFSNGAKDPHTGVATTDLYGKCTKTHSGTSAAARKLLEFLL
ncbi:suppressor of fused homolog [Caerostris extrusa]|uniref:Suppressor of fused homolog n=1 Tax=Caerostris extrusa TaxID=172846 RepID=A0AAV4VL78_CAEEX|nr:suppressor of fused homolog [Caerostris extrusa]